VAEKFAPSDDTVEAVKHWLLENGFSAERIRITGTKGWIGKWFFPMI
jgi:tripeptidyl-peptidase-1